ncbi:MAG: hypothetical protein HY540_07205 [Deltaproteobacteria bacterium]|nr:hypothetical protein [Deltaproteobacteria bacterium]
MIRGYAENGDVNRAITWLEKHPPPKRDQLLHYLDQGTLLHTAKRYEESNQKFQQAEAYIEEQSRQIASKSAAVVGNDNLIPYHARNFEKPLIDLYEALNWLGMGNPKEALIEVRQIDTRYAEHSKEEAPAYLQNAFIKFISAAIWSANGKINDAYIDEKWLLKKGFQNEELTAQGRRHCLALGRSDCSKWKNKNRELPLNNHGQLVVVVSQGWVPLKTSTEGKAGLQVFPLPTYAESFDVTSATVKIQGTSHPLTPFADMAKIVRDALKDEETEIIARATARFVTKTGAAVAVGTQVDEDLGILLGLLLLTTNEADLRSWGTLPRSFQGTTISLPAGTHELRLDGIRHEVEIRPGETTFIMLRTY